MLVKIFELGLKRMTVPRSLVGPTNASGRRRLPEVVFLAVQLPSREMFSSR